MRDLEFALEVRPEDERVRRNLQAARQMRGHRRPRSLGRGWRLGPCLAQGLAPEFGAGVGKAGLAPARSFQKPGSVALANREALAQWLGLMGSSPLIVGQIETVV